MREKEKEKEKRGRGRKKKNKLITWISESPLKQTIYCTHDDGVFTHDRGRYLTFYSEYAVSGPHIEATIVSVCTKNGRSVI